MALKMKEFLAQYQAEGPRVFGVQTCAACDVPLQETQTGHRHTDDGDLCTDCYFERLGEELDRRPIAMPRAVRTGNPTA